MTRLPQVPWRSLGWALVAVPGALQLALLAYAVFSRLSYPYDLEWMEGGLLCHADRLRTGEGIYVPPSVAFIPYLYTPLYPALIAGLGTVFGISYVLGRAISVVSLAVLGAVFWLAVTHEHAGQSGEHGRKQVRERALGRAAAVLSLGVFAAAYPWMEGWYDLVRADTLFLAMITGGLLLLRIWAPFGQGVRGHGRVAAASALLALSFFCKQTGVLYVALGGALLLAVSWRRVPTYVAVSGAIGLGGTYLGNRISGGWFWTYIFEVHQAHDFNMDRFYKSFSNILGKFPAIPGVVMLALVAIVVTRLVAGRWPRASGGLVWWTAVFAMSCVVGAVGWGTQWAHFNAYMPAMATGALTAGVAVCALWSAGATWREAARPGIQEESGAGAGEVEAETGEAEAGRLAVALAGAGAVALAVQLALALWDPRALIPKERDRAAGDALIAHLRELRASGEIYVPYHPWYARLAGQEETYVHRMGILDVTYGNRWQVAGLREALAQQRFAAVILDNRPVGNEFAGLANTYRLDDYLPREMAPALYTGARVVPQQVWVPVERRPPAGAAVLFDFEGGNLAGWTIQGSAWGRRPIMRPLSGQGEVRRYRGRYFLSSMHGGDRATGTLSSPRFRVDGKRMTLRLSGGTEGKERLRVELRVGDAAVRTATSAAPSERMVVHEWDVADLAGAEATLVLIDEATGSWGHLNVDDVLLWQD